MSSFILECRGKDHDSSLFYSIIVSFGSAAVGEIEGWDTDMFFRLCFLEIRFYFLDSPKTCKVIYFSYAPTHILRSWTIPKKLRKE